MDQERWRRVAELLDEALELSPAERERFLGGACGGDAALRREVEALLAADAEASPLLDTPLSMAALLAAGAGGHDGGALIDARIGPYRVVRELGRGGMGAVYLAERADGQFEHRVALKLVRGGFESADLVRRFLDERQILARLEHPHIARLLDGGVTDDGIPYFVMEYVEGEPITAHCDRHRLPVDARLRLFTAVCEAVAHAHRNLVVHRDLKPSNILVTPDGQVKLLDFGIAKLLGDGAQDQDSSQTRTGVYLLTPEYAAPEQVRGEPVTTATDVYALGAVLYELLSGRRAQSFSQRSPAELARVVGEVTPPPPSQAMARRARREGVDVPGAGPTEVAAARGIDPGRLERALRGDLDAIVMHALRKEPRQRYASVEALLADLERQRAGRPVAARHGTLAYRGRRFLRRHRVPVAAVALVVLSLLGGLVTATRQGRLAARESERAQQVTEFLIGLFRVSHPSESRGRELSARELLDSGVVRVERELADDPELQAEMLTLLGSIYRELAVLDRADTLLRRAVALRESLHGADSEALASSLNELGGLMLVTGNYDAADSVLRRSLAIRERRLGARDTVVAVSLNNLAVARSNLGDDVEAERLYRRALEIDLRVYGPEHPQVATDLSNLGNVLRRKADYDAADSVTGAAVAIRRRQLPAGDPKIADAIANLAMLRSAQGRLADAERLHREALAIRRATLGDDHPDVALSLNAVATTLTRLGRFDEALPLHQSALSLQQRVLGPEHDRAITTLNNIGVLRYRMGDVDEAAATMREALGRWRRALGENHPNVLTAQNNLGVVLTEAGQHGEAERLLRGALEARRALRGEDHPEVAASLRNLGVLLHGSGRPGEAEEAFRRALDIGRGAWPASHLSLADLLFDYGELLLDEHRPGEAEPLLREALTIRREQLGEAAAPVAEAKRTLMDALRAQGRDAEAEALAREAGSP